jgi:hypothetical protein
MIPLWILSGNLVSAPPYQRRASEVALGLSCRTKFIKGFFYLGATMSEEQTRYKIEGRESTIFRVIKSPDNPYVMVDRRPVDNPKLSFKAKGILTYLLSRPDGWEVNVPDLVNHSTDGAAAIRSGLKELRDIHHIKYNPTRQGGYIKKWVIEVYEIPYDLPMPEVDQADGESVLDSDFLQVGNLQVENRGEVLSTLSNNELNHGELLEIENQANRKVDAMLDMANFPGAKREIRLNAILSYIGSKLGVMAESRKWQEFAKFVDDRQLNHKESLERFISWMTAQKGYDIQFWPPAKMQDLWPQAFQIGEIPQNKPHEETELEKIQREGNWTPAPKRNHA